MPRPSGRAVAISLAVIAGIGLGTASALRLTDSNDGTATVGFEGPSGSTTVDPETASTAAEAPVTTVAPTTLIAPPPSEPAPIQSTDPKEVARSFALAYLSWRWDGEPEPDAAVRAACRPWTTDLLAAQLATSSGGGAFTARRIAAHEVSTASIINLDAPDAQTERTARYLALASISTTEDGVAAPAKSSVYLDMRLVKEGDRWLVDEIVR